MSKSTERRSKIRIPNGRKLHDYANLYFNGRNSMMFTIVKSRNVSEVCLLRVDPSVLDLPNVVIADCNAASQHVRFFDSITGLQEDDYDEVFSVSWNHANPVEKMRHKSRMCAEVLVPDIVDPSRVRGAYVVSDPAAKSLTKSVRSLNITVDTHKFFA